MKSAVWIKRVAIFCLTFCLTIGCILVGTVFWIDRGQAAFSCPIELKPGFSMTRTFRVHAKADYRIEIRCSRSIPFEKLKRILRAGDLVTITLLENRIPVPMRYFPNPPSRPGIVSSQNEDGNLGFAADWISQDIADFQGDPKKSYTITCSVIRPINELRSTNPTLIVGLDPLEVLSRAVDSFVLFAGAFLCFTLSALLGAVFFYLHRRPGRRARRSSPSSAR
jgi:hypothetical protein